MVMMIFEMLGRQRILARTRTRGRKALARGEGCGLVACGLSECGADALVPEA